MTKKEIAISQLLKHYVNDELTVKTSNELFKSQYREIEKNRRQQGDHDFIKSLNRDDKMIYSTHTKQGMTYAVSFILFAISLLFITQLVDINLMIVTGLVEIILLLCMSHVISSHIIKNCMMKYVKQHDIRIIKKVLNQGYCDKDAINDHSSHANDYEMLYRHLDYNESTTQKFTFKIDKKVMHIDAIPDKAKRSAIKQDFKYDMLDDQQVKEYVQTQLAVIEILNNNDTLSEPDIINTKDFDSMMQSMRVFITHNKVK